MHRMAAVLAFDAGIFIGYVSALALLAGAVKGSLRFSSAPRVVVIIAAAIAIRISWHRMLDRVYALSLTSMGLPVTNVAAFTLAGITLAAALTASLEPAPRKAYG